MLDDDDHRSLGQRLDLFHFEEEAPGMVFWHPRGLTLMRLLEETVRAVVRADGYEEVRTPQLLRQPIWEQSGHWQHFRDNMFVIDDGGLAAALKPVSCPGHLQIVRRRAPSYRDLPVRLAELGLVHRNEPGGTLHGLFRLRQFTQDDGHVICTEEQIGGEVQRFCAAVRRCYARFGFGDPAVALSTRPAQRAGDDAIWDRAEAALAAAAEAAGLPCTVQPGAGAFYGPKLELGLTDRLGRIWQCGTIQLDLLLPERFDVRYTDASGAPRTPVMLHRAMMGSLERFLGIVLEQHRGALPPWLAPVQVAVAPVAADQRAAAESVAEAMEAAGLRARLDGDEATLSRRIAIAHGDGVPFVAIVGAREAAAGTVTLRERGGGQRTVGREAAVAELRERCAVAA